MKIVDIFAEEYPGHLHAFMYIKYDTNEYDRLMELWTDVHYLRTFAKKNKVENINQFVKQRLRDAENIQNLIDELLQESQPLEHYFRPLHDQETGIKKLSRQKGKTSYKVRLRHYGIKIDRNCCVITGGSINMSETMDCQEGKREELRKINKAKAYLKEHDVFDENSLFEFNLENEV